MSDARLKRWFSADQLRLMKEAVEDHRASASRTPRSIYGKIVAEADRDLEPSNVIRRTIQFGLANYAELMKTRAIMLTCFQYRRDPDSPYHYDGGAEDLVEYKDVNPIVTAFEHAESVGVESWFVEMSIHPEGVALEKYGRIESKV